LDSIQRHTYAPEFFGPSLSWQLFASGRIRANIAQRKALQEVDDAWVTAAKEEEHHKALVEALAANRKAVDLATKLYTEGQIEFLNLLDTRRSLYTCQDDLSQSTRTLSTNFVALYKALGGGRE